MLKKNDFLITKYSHDRMPGFECKCNRCKGIYFSNLSQGRCYFCKNDPWYKEHEEEDPEEEESLLSEEDEEEDPEEEDKDEDKSEDESEELCSMCKQALSTTEFGTCAPCMQFF